VLRQTSQTLPRNIETTKDVKIRIVLINKNKKNRRS
jgi:hypothetical protein